MKAPRIIRLEVYNEELGQTFVYIFDIQTDKSMSELEREWSEEAGDGGFLNSDLFPEWLREKEYVTEVELDTYKVGF